MDRWLFNETVLRVFALLLACAIWLGVNAPITGNNTPVPTSVTEGFPYPVRTIAAQNEVVTGLSDTSAQVVVAGTTATLTTLPDKMANVQVVADATALSTGKHTVKLDVLNAPAVSYVVQPSVVTVVLERKVNQRQPIHFVIRGEAAKGYMVGAPSADVSMVNVSGSRSAVNRVYQVIASVPLNQPRSTVTETVALLPIQPDGRPVSGVTLSPDNAVVTVPLRAPRSIANIAVQVIGDPAPGFAVSAVTVIPSTVQIYGSSTVRSTSTVTVPVNVSGIRRSSTVRVTVPVMPGADRVVPATLSATVSVQPSATRLLTNIPVRLVGTPPGDRLTVTGGQTINVSVSGPKSAVERLLPSGVTAFADMSKVPPGQATVPINVELPDWVRVTQLSAATLQVTVTKG